MLTFSSSQSHISIYLIIYKYLQYVNTKFLKNKYFFYKKIDFKKKIFLLRSHQHVHRFSTPIRHFSTKFDKIRHKSTRNITVTEHLKLCSTKKDSNFTQSKIAIKNTQNYLKGCLAGVPDFLGYLLGVFLTFSITITFLFISVPGKQNSSLSLTMPPNSFKAKPASLSSSSI